MKKCTETKLFSLVRTHEGETGLTDTTVLAAATEEKPLIDVLRSRVQADEYGFIQSDRSASQYFADDFTMAHILSLFGSVRYEILPIETFLDAKTHS